MRYKIIGRRGVLKEGSLFLIDEGNPLELCFDNLPPGTYELVLYGKDGKLDRRLCQKHEGDTALIEAFRLRAGIWHVELVRIEDGKATDKIVCAPIKIDTLATVSDGLVAFPEIDDLVAKVAELEATVAELYAWMEQVAPTIHTHKITL